MVECGFMGCRCQEHLTMKISFWVALVLLVICSSRINSQAQEIKMFKSFGGVVFEMDTITLSMKQTMSVLNARNAAAYQEFKRAKTRLDVSSVMGFTGGVLVVVPMVTAIAGGEPEWAIAAGGAALMIGSIPLYRSFRGRALHALDIYNGHETARLKPELYFWGSGAKVVVRF